MMTRNLAAVATAMLVAATVSVAPADARTHDDRATFTFPAPVSIPGGTLPAGEYIFRLADPDSGRSIVQVLDRAGNVHGMFFTHRMERETPADTAEVHLGEASVGEVRSIRAWWQPGDTSGRAFQYRTGEASWERDSAVAPIAD
jgi:hypothetical protein